jgi:hypothetical protein
MKIYFKYLFIIFFCSCNSDLINYKSTLDLGGEKIETHLKWLSKNKDIGSINIHILSNDSLTDIKKYIFYKKNDTIRLSNESEDNIAKYTLKIINNGEILIQPIEDDYLFELEINEMILKQE